MMTFDPRTIGKPVYEALSSLRSQQEEKEKNQDRLKERLKEQKNQAVELYTYLSTWGLMRLKAEEKAISQDKPGKKEVVHKYFDCLQTLSNIENLPSEQGLNSEQGLKVLKDLGTDEYLGLTGLGLALAQEFSFWASAVYWDIKGE
jgi:aminoglycoside/choline kinase family phosphotransferase